MKRRFSASRWTRVMGLLIFCSAAAISGCSSGLTQIIPKTVPLDVQEDPEVRALIESELGIVNAPQLTDYINAVAQSLVKFDPELRIDIEVVVYDRFTPNIFAIPGGTIYISRGMLVLLKNEAELAHLLAHQIAHISLNHVNRQVAPFIRIGVLRIDGDLVKYVIDQKIQPLVAIPLRYLSRRYMASHSPRDEFEADGYGHLMASDAGYNPAAMPELLNRLHRSTATVAGEAHLPGFFDIHVSDYHRYGRLRDDADEIEWDRQPTGQKDPERFLQMLDGLLVGVNPDYGLMAADEYRQPGSNIAFSVPAEWSVAVSKEAIVSVAPSAKAILSFASHGPSTSPEQSARRFTDTIKTRFNIDPIESRPATIGGYTAYLVTYRDMTGEEPVHLVLAWIQYGAKTIELFGLGIDRRYDQLLNSCLSFRALNARERSQIMEKRLKLVRAQENEDIRQLSARTGNIWDPGTTAVVNGIHSQQDLKSGELVKIAVKEPYR